MGATSGELPGPPAAGRPDAAGYVIGKETNERDGIIARRWVGPSREKEAAGLAQPPHLFQGFEGVVLPEQVLEVEVHGAGDAAGAFRAVVRPAGRRHARATVLLGRAHIEDHRPGVARPLATVDLLCGGLYGSGGT